MGEVNEYRVMYQILIINADVRKMQKTPKRLMKPTGFILRK